MNTIAKKIKAAILKRRDIKKGIQAKIRATLDSAGWKIVERDIKDRLRENYKSLIKVSPKDVEKRQTEIRIALDFVENIYYKAGLNWEYDGYSEIKELKIEDGDLAKEEQLYREYLKKVSEDEDA